MTFLKKQKKNNIGLLNTFLLTLFTMNLAFAQQNASATNPIIKFFKTGIEMVKEFVPFAAWIAFAIGVIYIISLGITFYKKSKQQGAQIEASTFAYKLIGAVILVSISGSIAIVKTSFHGDQKVDSNSLKPDIQFQ